MSIDNLNRVDTKTYDNGQKLTYTYGGDGTLQRVKETGGSAARFYYYNYDRLERLISSRMVRGTSTLLLQTSHEYNADNQLVKQSWTVGAGSNAGSYSKSYTYDENEVATGKVKQNDMQTL